MAGRPVRAGLALALPCLGAASAAAQQAAPAGIPADRCPKPLRPVASIIHGTPPALLECELRAVGYRQVAFHPLEGGAAFLAVFTPPSQPPAPASILPCQAGAAR